MRQRIVIAIALVNNPRLLIADEPTTALDVTVQAQILDLIRTLQDEYQSAVMLITHDLGVIAETAERVMVMYAGHAVEVTAVNDLFQTPTHPYSLGLLGSVHSLDASTRGGLRTITGTPPSLINLPSGCAFHPRCRFELGEGSVCRTAAPSLQQVGASVSACHLPQEQLVQLGTKDGV
jgi:peptide/nickel transport system ATP-binding protein